MIHFIFYLTTSKGGLISFEVELIRIDVMEGAMFHVFFPLSKTQNIVLFLKYMNQEKYFQNLTGPNSKASISCKFS